MLYMNSPLELSLLRDSCIRQKYLWNFQIRGGWFSDESVFNKKIESGLYIELRFNLNIMLSELQRIRNANV